MSSVRMMVPPAPSVTDGGTCIDDSGSSRGSRDEKRTEGWSEGGAAGQQEQEAAWHEAGNPRENQEEEEEEEEEEGEEEGPPMDMRKFVLGLRRQPTSKAGGSEGGREGGREGGKGPAVCSSDAIVARKNRRGSVWLLSVWTGLR